MGARYLLIPLEHAVPSLRDATLSPKAFERTIETCEPLVTYAVAIAGKPSCQ